MNIDSISKENFERAITLLAKLYEADNRVWSTAEENDERAEEYAHAMGETGEFLSLIDGKIPSKEGNVALGFRPRPNYNGCSCPACESEDIESSKIESEINIAWSNVVCHACSFSWDDEYSLNGFSVNETQLNELEKMLHLHNSVSVYKAEGAGWGFTNCESEDFRTREEAVIGAWQHYRSSSV